MDKDNNLGAYPPSSLGDYAIELLKGADRSSVPTGSAVPAFMKTERSRRLDAFHERMAKRVRELESAAAPGLLKRALEGDQDAKDNILSSYSVIKRLVEDAMDEEKREILALAMVSTLLWPEDADDTERRYFLRCLSNYFQAIHIQLLDRSRGGALRLRELVDQEGVAEQIAQSAWNELYREKMVNCDWADGLITESGMKLDRRTPRGTRFLRFVGGASDVPCSPQPAEAE